MSQKVVVDQEACIGCGNCEAVCPEVFKLNEDERSQVIKPEGGPDCVEDAIDQCPAEAISWQ
ncbi:MAG: ferredoxin, partial [Proteobacteria bacterium]|nr:ferredoxin [Pseudomonadota bacterium]